MWEQLPTLLEEKKQTIVPDIVIVCAKFLNSQTIILMYTILEKKNKRIYTKKFGVLMLQQVQACPPRMVNMKELIRRL